MREVVARNLADASLPELSNDARAGLSYDAARAAANMVVRASGYRVRGLRSHETTFDVLALAGDALASYVPYLQVLRHKRHALTYATAGDTSDAEASEALEQAGRLMTDVERWLREQHPELAD